MAKLGVLWNQVRVSTFLFGSIGPRPNNPCIRASENFPVKLRQKIKKILFANPNLGRKYWLFIVKLLAAKVQWIILRLQSSGSWFESQLSTTPIFCLGLYSFIATTWSYISNSNEETTKKRFLFHLNYLHRAVGHLMGSVSVSIVCFLVYIVSLILL